MALASIAATQRFCSDPSSSRHGLSALETALLTRFDGLLRDFGATQDGQLPGFPIGKLPARGYCFL